MYPTEETKLPSQLIPLEIGDEANETEGIQHEGDESMMPREWNEVSIYEDNVLKVRIDGSVSFAYWSILDINSRVP